MTWTNAFDVGECTVSVYTTASNTPAYVGVMGKGDSQEAVVAQWELTLIVSVSSDGVVSLTGNPLGTAFREVAVFVTPPNADQPMRLSDITAALGTGGTESAIGWGDWNSDDWIVELSGAGSVWTPDPCELPAGAPAIGLDAVAAVSA